MGDVSPPTETPFHDSWKMENERGAEIVARPSRSLAWSIEDLPVNYVRLGKFSPLHANEPVRQMEGMAAKDRIVVQTST
jgi:hypothetical protein